VGQFQYANLNSPVSLSAGTLYYLMSQETAGGDTWYNYDTTVKTASVATESSAAWGYGIGQWYLAGVAGQAFVPVDFKYVTATPAAQAGSVIGQAPGTAQGSTAISSLPIAIEDAHWTNAIGFQLSFSAQPGQSYEIQSSTNAHNWSSTGTVIADAQKASFVDTNAVSVPFRLYRVRQSP